MGDPVSGRHGLFCRHGLFPGILLFFLHPCGSVSDRHGLFCRHGLFPGTLLFFLQTDDSDRRFADGLPARYYFPAGGLPAHCYFPADGLPAHCYFPADGLPARCYFPADGLPARCYFPADGLPAHYYFPVDGLPDAVPADGCFVRRSVYSEDGTPEQYFSSSVPPSLLSLFSAVLLPASSPLPVSSSYRPAHPKECSYDLQLRYPFPLTWRASLCSSYSALSRAHILLILTYITTSYATVSFSVSNCFLIPFANPASVTARDARNSFPIACPKVSLSP